MLTGAMGPTSGYATVAGRDIRTDLLAIRQNIGICLQHDCLFPNLTVREHLQFFSRLKGLYKKVSLSEAEAHIDQAIRDVALFEKRNSLSKNLSGGMKRKLSVAIAFCGDSKVVILDEPTSGMVSAGAPSSTVLSVVCPLLHRAVNSPFLNPFLFPSFRTPFRDVSRGMVGEWLAVAVAGSILSICVAYCLSSFRFPRSIPPVIRQYRQDRCIVLTTHFMVSMGSVHHKRQYLFFTDSSDSFVADCRTKPTFLGTGLQLWREDNSDALVARSF